MLDKRRPLNFSVYGGIIMSNASVTDAKNAEYMERYMEGVKKRNPGEPEFHQAVFEVETTEQEEGLVVQEIQTGYIMHE